MATTYAIRSFAFGEVDQKVSGNVDAQWYSRACKSLRNMFPYATGPAEKRPGTMYAGTTKTHGKKVKLFTWKLSQISSIIIEAGDSYFRFYKNGAVLGAPYEVVTPWTESDLPELEFCQVGTASYWVHPLYAPRKLTYTSDTSWTLSTPTFTAGVGEETFSGAGHYPSHVELFQDRLIFARTLLALGTFWGSRTSTYENFMLRRTAAVTLAVASPGVVGWTAHGFTVNDCVSFTTAGTLPTGLAAGVGYYVLAAGLSANGFQVSATPGGAAINFTGSPAGVHTGWASPPLATDAWQKTPQAHANNEILWLLAEDSLLFGTSDGTFVAAGKGEALNPDVAWWPTRQTSNGSTNVPALLVDDFACFVSKGGKRVYKFQYQNEADKYLADDLTQLASHIAGTGIIGMAHQREPVSCLWAWTSDGQLLAAQYDRAAGSIGWSVIDIGGKVESTCVESTSDEDRVWVSIVRTIGGVAYRYLEYFSPRGWDATADYNGVDSAYVWDGGAAVDVVSISAANPAVCTAIAHGFQNNDLVRFDDVTGNTDPNGEVYTVKNKTADTFQLYTRDGSTAVNLLVAGSGGSVRKVTDIVSGLTWLEGETVRAAGDGAAIPDVVVTAGTATLADYANKIHIGLPFTAHLEPLPVAEARNKLKQIKKVTGLFYKSVDARVGTSLDSMQPIIFLDNEPTMDTSPPEATVTEKVLVEGFSDYEGNLILESDAPLPLTILSLLYEIVGER